MALQDDPHRMRVRRQIATWEDGPPQGWQPLPPQVQVNPQTGQQQLVPPNPLQDPVLGGIFMVLPCDQVQHVAQVREYELGRALAGTKFSRQPPPWQAGIVAAYEGARQAAGMFTVAEMQRAQAQQAQAAQQQQGGTAQAQAKMADTQSRERIEAAKLADKKEERAAEMQTEQVKAAVAMQTARERRRGEELDVTAARG
jgi:hypothetical protein